MDAMEELRRSPREVRMVASRLAKIETLLQRGIDEQWYTAAVYVVMRAGGVAAAGALGTPDPRAGSQRSADLDTVFDLASITKPFTATLLLQLVEDGALHMDQEVRFVLPEAAEAPVGKATVRQLSSHTSGLPSWKAVHETPSPIDEILSTPLLAEPGEAYTYSDLGYILLGHIVAQLGGKPLQDLAQERIFRPLGMMKSGFLPAAELQENMAATTAPQGVVHDPNARGMGGVAGHAGIFAPASDLARFMVSFGFPRAASSVGIPPVLSSVARKLAATLQTKPGMQGHSIGWFHWPSDYLPKGDLLSNRTFGHTGFTGTSLLFDPDASSRLALLLLTNRVYFEKERDGAPILRLRRLYSNVVAAAIDGLTLERVRVPTG